MIVTRLKGGLGNQLFQWACALDLSQRLGTPFYLDTSFFSEPRAGVTRRSFALSKFPRLSVNLLAWPPDRPCGDETTERALIRLTERDDLAALQPGDQVNHLLDGYWQAEKYFVNVAGTVHDRLAAPVGLTERFANAFGLSEGSVSMHVRRTDYLSSNGYHPVQPLAYYQRALDRVGEFDSLLVFSDDMVWCRENLKFDRMHFVEGNDDVVDLWLMSMCHHNIIANSSFSWWAAWLNRNASKRVICPANWFGKRSLNQRIEVPASWARI